MTLSAVDYLAHIRHESARFLAVLERCDPAAAVPSCPEWSAADLLWHLVEVQRFWTRAVLARPAEPAGESDPARPLDYGELRAEYQRAAEGLAQALKDVNPDDSVWSWRRPDDTVIFVLRRQAHEALIHRIDAELTAGTLSEIDARLAADGCVECLDVMYGGQPGWGTWRGSDDYLRLDCLDAAVSVWVRLGRFSGVHPETGDEIDEGDLHVVADPGREPVAVVTGSAADLDCWLWHRRDDSGLRTSGDPEALARLRAVLRQPIN